MTKMQGAFGSTAAAPTASFDDFCAAWRPRIEEALREQAPRALARYPFGEAKVASYGRASDGAFSETFDEAFDGAFSEAFSEAQPLKQEQPKAVDALAKQEQVDTLLYQPFCEFSLRAAKRTRPLLCLLGAASAGADPACALTPALAIELFQSAALIHDDIADESVMRRGLPCVHITQGIGPALNQADLGIVYTFQLLLEDAKLTPPQKLALLEELALMERLTVEGQALDLGWVRDHVWNLTIDDYIYMATRKTAYYSAATPLVMGALCASAAVVSDAADTTGATGTTDALDTTGGTAAPHMPSPKFIEGLRNFGVSCGLAFQIQDDLLNLEGSAAALGKDYQSDITEGKRTFMVAWALEHLAQEPREELIGILKAHSTDSNIKGRAIELMQKVNALEEAHVFAQNCIAQGLQILDELKLAAGTRSILKEMATYFIERAK